MISITFEDLKSFFLRPNKLEIFIRFTNKSSVLLHFSDFDDYKKLRDYLFDYVS